LLRAVNDAEHVRDIYRILTFANYSNVLGFNVENKGGFRTSLAWSPLLVLGSPLFATDGTRLSAQSEAGVGISREDTGRLTVVQSAIAKHPPTAAGVCTLDGRESVNHIALS
jgi:hypothetical protein